MKTIITPTQVKSIADLANIELPQEELEKLGKEIEAILEYVAQLSEVDTKGAEFRSQTDLKNVFREDLPKPSLSQEEAISNRKRTSKAGHFTISTVITK